MSPATRLCAAPSRPERDNSPTDAPNAPQSPTTPLTGRTAVRRNPLKADAGRADTPDMTTANDQAARWDAFLQGLANAGIITLHPHHDTGQRRRATDNPTERARERFARMIVHEAR